jgi:C-terminal processing protease CtpA/Prc
MLVTTLRCAAVAVVLLGMMGCPQTKIDPQPSNYVGIGVELTMEAAGARVTRVVEGGPAAEMGLAVGDVILEVGGKSARGNTLAEVVSRMRGEPGSTLQLLARTKDGNKSLTLTRRAIDNKS